MATYVQWLRQRDEGELKRAWWVTGPEAALRERVVEGIKRIAGADDLDRVTMWGDEPGVWDVLNTYPTMAEGHRVVVVRDAHRITDWTPLEDWITTRALPRVHAVFVSTEGSTEDPAIGLVAKRGRLVKCGPVSEKDFATIITDEAAGAVTPAAIDALAQRCGTLREALQVVAVARLWGQTVDDKVVVSLTTAGLPAAYADELIACRLGVAAAVARDVDPDEVSAVIGLADSRLGTLGKLHRQMIRGRSARESAQAESVPMFLAAKLASSVRWYDAGRIAHCRSLLAGIDAAVGDGARDGVLEVLAALW